jgi:hypothetical protein
MPYSASGPVRGRITPTFKGDDFEEVSPSALRGNMMAVIRAKTIRIRTCESRIAVLSASVAVTPYINSSREGSITISTVVTITSNRWG